LLSVDFVTDVSVSDNLFVTIGRYLLHSYCIWRLLHSVVWLIML